ncbi:MAG: YCF48-related protein [Candidatus Omnitrophica bacterium]|nr:YCF48-related protein [Candidatus Omnitrophota bacterium]
MLSGIVYIFVFILSLLVITRSDSNILWQDSSDGLREKNVKCILFDFEDRNQFFVGTDRALYVSNDQGKYYKKILNIPKSGGVNYLAQDRSCPQDIFAATADGLFISRNEGKSWQNIFRGKNEMQRYCKTVLILKDIILLGTKEGLFFTRDNAKTWDRLSGKLGTIEIIAMAAGAEQIFLATIEGVYVLSSDLDSQDKLYSITGQESPENNNGDSDYAAEESKGTSRITDIKIDHKNSRNIYFSSDEGLFYSQDDGESWQRLNSGGLLSQNIKCIQFLDNNNLVVGTEKGVFEFNGGKWQQFYKGMTANNINFLATDSSRNLWAATDEGVFRGSSRDLPAMKRDEQKNTQEVFKDEPSIQEIQKQAIRYAEVDPRKIKSWRRRAQLAALMPSVSLDYDKTVATSLSSSYERAFVGPRDWGLSLSWDVGELIWNPDQTSIDSRSKLMVELRESILDEVTRLYFERRRLQTELLISPPEEASERLDETLRLEELTASIDALTGGYLSRCLNNKVIQQP